MTNLVRVLSAVFWVAAGLTALWILLDVWGGVDVARVFGDAGASFVYTVLLGAMALCSGGILWHEWRNNPIEHSEYGEWTGRQLFFAIVFAITFFIAFISFANWFFQL
jgi:hypothetical protein